MIRVLELADPDNFFESGYLMANPDVNQFALKSGHTGRYHYDLYGHGEGRRQFTREFLLSIDRVSKEKDARFQNVLKPVKGIIPILFGSSSLAVFQYPQQSNRCDRWITLMVSLATADFTIFWLIYKTIQTKFSDIGCGLRDVIHENCLYIEVYTSITADLIVAPDCYYPLPSGPSDREAERRLPSGVARTIERERRPEPEE